MTKRPIAELIQESLKKWRDAGVLPLEASQYEHLPMISRGQPSSAKGSALEGGENMEKLDRITVNPEVCFGQPTIRGMRITVGLILKTLAGCKSAQEVLEAHPELEPEDIQQALKYAARVVSDQQMVPNRIGGRSD